MKKLYTYAAALIIAGSLIFTNNVQAQTWQTLGTPGFSPYSSYFPSLAFSPEGELYIFISGSTNGTAVMKYNGTTWETVGNAAFFNGGSESFGCLAFGPDGAPYVGMRGYGSANGGHASVMKYDGNAWVHVGAANFTETPIDAMFLKFSNSGEPYVAYQSTVAPYKAIVKKFNGSSWEDVGAAGGLSPGGADGLSLAFSPAGEPYVAYTDATNAFKATVKKFDGSNWVTVGTPGGISTSNERYPHITFSPSGEPYVSYMDVALSFKATVIKFNGTNWSTVGTAGFTPGSIGTSAPLAFSTDGEPYVTFRDGANGYKATVYKFDGNSWVAVGNSGFSEGIVEYVSLVFGSDGKPYVGYQDQLHDNKATVMTLDNEVGVEDITELNYVSIYPNPANNVLNIKTTSPIKTINIYNALGTLIQTETRSSFSIEQLPAGVYTVHVSTAKGEHTEKLIVQ